MPHIHTAPGDHDHTVTAFIIRTDSDEPRALLHLHKKLDILLPVGGHIEVQETPWQGMAHELEEESGYSLSDLKILQPKDRITSFNDAVLHPYPISLNTHRVNDEHSHSDISYGFVASGDPKHTVKDGESADLRWLTRKEVADLPKGEITENTRDAYLFMFDTALSSWDVVSTKDFKL